MSDQRDGKTPIPPTSKSRQVFVSYAHDDWSIVDDLYRDIHNRPFYNVWIDAKKPDDFLPGENIRAKLAQAISDSFAFVMCLSPDYETSDWCKWEWQQAKEKGIKVIPVIVKDVDKSSLDKFGLSGVMYMNSTTRESYNVGIENLRKALIHEWKQHFKQDWRFWLRRFAPQAAAIVAAILVILSVQLAWAALNPPPTPPVPPATAIPIPDGTEFSPVRATLNMDVARLALSPDGHTLWFVTNPDSNVHELYSLDTTKENNADLSLPSTVIGLSNIIYDFIVDCRGKPWVLLDGGFSIGGGPLMTASSISRWSYDKASMYSAASRCTQNGRVEIWMARGSAVYTLSYDGSDTANLTGEAPTSFPGADLENVQRMLFTNNDTVLQILDDGKNRLFSLSVDTSAQAQEQDLSSIDLLTAMTRASSGTLWIASASDLFSIQGGQLQPSIPLEGMDRLSLAVDDTQVWVGRRCNSNDGTITPGCDPLLVFRSGNSAPAVVPHLQGVSVRDLVVDPEHGLWVATQNGIIFRATNQVSGGR